MPLINCKVEVKLRWTNYCVFSVAANDNDGANPTNLVFAIEDTKLYVPVVTLLGKDYQKPSKLLSKDLKDEYTGMNIKQEKRPKIQQMSIDVF